MRHLAAPAAGEHDRNMDQREGRAERGRRRFRAAHEIQFVHQVVGVGGGADADASFSGLHSRHRGHQAMRERIGVTVSYVLVTPGTSSTYMPLEKSPAMM